MIGKIEPGDAEVAMPDSTPTSYSGGLKPIVNACLGLSAGWPGDVANSYLMNEINRFAQAVSARLTRIAWAALE